MSKWKKVIWSEVVEIKNGRNHKAVENIDGQYPIYGSGGVMGYANDYLCEEDSVIIGRKGNINKPIYVSEKFWNVDTAFGLKGKQNMLLSKYLYYFCIKFNFERLNTTVTIPSLTKSNLLNIEIPLPPIETQKKIAITVDNVAELLAMRKQQLAELDNLIKSTFYKMFGDPVSNSHGWPVKRIGDFSYVTKLAGFEYTKYFSYKNKGEVVVIKGLNVKERKLKLDTVSYIDKSISDLLPRSKLFTNDIVMTYIGINIGDVAIIEGGNNYHLAPNVAKITVKCLDEYNPYFLVNLLYYCRNFFAGGATNTAKQALNMERIRSIPVITPPFTLQTEFARVYTKIEEQKALVQKALDETQYLFDSLMSEYFD